ncbi:MAG: hypothetical protein EOP82_28215 [Variovorax sp.]|nr:MAG: hypothetical protein EOP82_28215 [Variovorax sp.]
MRLPAPSTRTRAILCVLAFAMWLATTLGFVHRTVHNPLTAHAPIVSVEALDTEAAGHAHHGLTALFGDHTNADCRLYDQLSHGPAALCVPLLVLPMALPAATFACLEGEAIARWVALFDARGPPSTR